MGIPWSAAPIATLSSPRGVAHPCVYRGFCVIGCTTNAKQSVLVTWIPRAIERGAEIRDSAMVGRIEIDRADRATGVHYYRQGQWRFQRARQVVVAGYSIETPRLLLLNSACPACPDGVANSSGFVGKYLMVPANHGVYGELDDEVRWYKAPPSLVPVTIEGIRFQPERLTVARGDTVVWVNKDLAPHTATSDDAVFDSKTSQAAKSWRFTARKKGEFAYICTFHPTMTAVLRAK
jgi:plastocyanin